MMRDELACIVCLGKMENIDPEGSQPSGGLAFRTGGHYGSTVFDPMDGSSLIVNVCDHCLTGRAGMGLVLAADPRGVRQWKESLREWKG